MTEQPSPDPSLGISSEDEDRTARRRDRKGDPETRSFAIAAARLLHELHLEDILVLDLRNLWDVTDYVVIATGTSDRQIRSVGHDVEDVGKGMGVTRFGRDADVSRSWVVLDFVDVIVHLFDAEMRAYYDLEMLWGDAPKVDWREASSPDDSG